MLRFDRAFFTRATRVALSLCLMAMAAVFAVTATPQQARAESAADTFVQCLNGSKSGDLIILVDTSASLQTTDQEAARVRAAEFLIKRLARSADGSNVKINVALAGFANRYEPASEFVQLNGQSQQGVLKKMKEFANRQDGEGTDYWLGLDGARRELAERKQNNPTTCQGIVFFSDGTLDIDRAPDEAQKPIDRPYDPDNPLESDADRERARKRAAESMCREGGLADQLRVAPITLFGIGLTGAPGGDDFSLMERVSSGDCGAQPANGQFDTADDIDGLLQAFDKISGESITQEGGFCTGQQDKCEEGAHTFVLDSSVGSVSVLGNGDLENYQVLVVSPGGEEMILKNEEGEQTGDVAGVGLTWEWMSDKSFTLDLDKNDADQAWTGQWQIIFIDAESKNPEAKSRTSLQVTGNIMPEWRNSDIELRAGEEVPLEFGLADPEGEAIDPASIKGKATFDAVLVDSDGTEHPIVTAEGKEIEGEQTLDTTDLPQGEGTLRMSLAVTTASWKAPDGKEVPGTELRPQVSEVPVTIGAPAGFPTITGQASFGAIEGDVEDAPGTVQVTGPGCVWVDGATPPTITTGPDEVTSVTITSPHSGPENCLKVGEGETAELPVALTSQSGNGALNGTFVVMSSSADDPNLTQESEVGYNAELTRPLNATNFVLTLIAALLLGPGIPIGLLYLAKWATAKIPGRGLIYTPIPVTVENGQILREGQPIEWRDGDFTHMAPMQSGGQRRLQLGPITLRAKTGASPFGPGFVDVESPGRVGASSQHTQPVGKENRARLELGVHNSWVMVCEPQPGPEQTMVVFLTAADATPATRDRLMEDLQNKGPQVWQRLSQAQPPQGQPPQPGQPAQPGQSAQPGQPPQQGQQGPPPGFGQPGPFQGESGPGPNPFA